MNKDWKKVKLGDICKTTQGIQIPKLEQIETSQHGYIRYLYISDFFSNENLKFIKDEHPDKVVTTQDIVMANTGSPGKVFRGVFGVLSNNLFKISFDSSQINTNYLYYFLSSNDFQSIIQSQMKQGIQQHLGHQTINRQIVPIPPLPEQKCIAAILDKADAIRRKRRETILLLDEFLRSTFLWMFGDPVKNEKGWTKRKLEEVCEIVTGNTPSRDESENYGNFIEWIKSDNINTPYHFISKADEYLSKIGLQKGRSIDKDSILMTCIAGSLNCIGNVALVNRKVAFNQQINGMVPVNINLFFLYVQFLVSKKYIQSASTNSMKGMISKGTLSKLEFIVPPDKAQRVFANFFLRYIRERELLEKSLAEMENNFNSLMQRAFRGEM